MIESRDDMCLQKERVFCINCQISVIVSVDVFSNYWPTICVERCTCYVTYKTFSSRNNRFSRLLSDERTDGSAGLGIGSSCCRDSAARTGCRPDGKSLRRHCDIQLHKFDWCQPGSGTSIFDDVFSVFSCDVAVRCLGRQP